LVFIVGLSQVEGLLISYRETVSSVGVLMTHFLPFVESNQAIKTFRHALALDEVRISLLLVSSELD
jgi:hypothetical protein